MEHSEQRYLLELQTDQCNQLKAIFNVLKDLLFDTNLYFDESGMKTCRSDRMNIALVKLELSADYFLSYRCEKPLMLGVNVTSLSRYLGNVTQNGNRFIRMLVPEDCSELILEIVNDDNSEVRRKRIRLLDLDEPQSALECGDYTLAINMRSKKFAQHCQDHADVGDYMDISTAGPLIRFYTAQEDCVGDTAESIFIADHGGNKKGGTSKSDTAAPEARSVVDDVVAYYSDADKTITGRFSLKFLQMFAKASAVAPNVVIYFENDQPLILDYPVGEHGDLRFALAPRVTTM